MIDKVLFMKSVKPARERTIIIKVLWLCFAFLMLTLFSFGLSLGESFGQRSQNFTRTQDWNYTKSGKKIRIELTYGGPKFLTPLLGVVKVDGKIIRKFKKYEDFKKKDKQDYPQLYSKFADVKLLPARVKKSLQVLKKYDPLGYSIYQELKDKSGFEGHIQSHEYYIDDVLPSAGGLIVAVHESLHNIDTLKAPFQYSHYYTINKSYIKVRRQNYLPQRNVIYDYLNKEDKKDSDLMTKARTYLKGQSGTMPFEVFLDEVNAYTIGANTGYNLFTKKGTPYTSNKIYLEKNTFITEKVNPGIVHFMRFTTLYINHLKLKKRGAFNKLKRDKSYTAVVLQLWRQAETVLNKICSSKLPLLDDIDKNTLHRTYSDKSMDSLKLLFYNKEEFTVPKNCR